MHMKEQATFQFSHIMYHIILSERYRNMVFEAKVYDQLHCL